MAGIAESGKLPRFSPLSATVAELKCFLAENGLSTTEKKAKLQERLANFVEIGELELTIDAKAFADFVIVDAHLQRLTGDCMDLGKSITSG